MENKFACITGADRGVGFELTRKLLIEGFTVFAGRVLEDWNLLEGLKEEYGEQLHIIYLDISEDNSVEKARNYVFSKTEKLDILINNGAILGDMKANIFDELDFEEMQRVFNVNALGALRVSRALVHLVMKSETKLIINISSEAGSISTCWREGWFAYCMSKAALNMNSSIVHNNIKELGGQVLVIHPGHVKTYMQGKLDEAGSLSAEESAKHIVKLAFEHEKYKGDKPSFINYLGNKMEW
jgi:NAD(P)-dependent dehydrogenase (short-subunit alcohol dehydrogenase family)